MMKRLLKVLLPVIVFSLALQAAAFSARAQEEEGPKKVIILPFKMNADRDLGFLREGIYDMLYSRLYWEGKVEIPEKGVVMDAVGDYSGAFNKAFATRIGRELNADYVLYGSLTVFGESASLDATMANLKEEKPPVTVYVQTEGMEGVIPEINKFAQKINAKVFDRPYGDEEFAYVPKGSQGTVPGDRRASQLNPNFTAFKRVDVAGSTFWKSKTFEEEIRGMDVGDVDGDGQNELVLLEGNHIGVYRYGKKSLHRVADHLSSDRERFLKVDVADINGNGRAEIFASKISQNTVTSEVLEFEGKSLRHLVRRSPWFFRVLDWPGKGMILVGQQKMGGPLDEEFYVDMIGDYFEDGIFELTFEKDEYVKASEEPLLDIPNVFIFNFAIGDLGQDEAPEIVMIDRNDRLRVLDRNGDIQNKTSEPYGGTLNHIVLNPAGHEGREEKLDEKWLYVPARILIVDLDRDNQNEIIINKNEETTFGLMERFKAFSAGRIVSLSWTGLSLEPNWESTKLTGCLSDYQVKDLDNDGNPDLVVSLLQERGAAGGMKKARSVVVSYRLMIRGGRQGSGM